MHSRYIPKTMMSDMLKDLLDNLDQLDLIDLERILLFTEMEIEYRCNDE